MALDLYCWATYRVSYLKRPTEIPWELLKMQCLNEHWFITMAQARKVIELWRIEYNTERPHSSIGNLTPEEYAEKIMAQINQRTLLSTSDS